MMKKEAIAMAVEEGKSVKEICEIFECKPTYVYKVKSELKSKTEADDMEEEWKDETKKSRSEEIKKEDKPVERDRSESESDTETSEEEVSFECDSCGKKVKLGQLKCKCGDYIDWRGVLDEHPTVIICGDCGTSVGKVGDGEVKCPKCGASGEI